MHLHGSKESVGSTTNFLPGLWWVLKRTTTEGPNSDNVDTIIWHRITLEPFLRHLIQTLEDKNVVHNTGHVDEGFNLGDMPGSLFWKGESFAYVSGWLSG